MRHYKLLSQVVGLLDWIRLLCSPARRPSCDARKLSDRLGDRDVQGRTPKRLLELRRRFGECAADALPGDPKACGESSNRGDVRGRGVAVCEESVGGGGVGGGGAGRGGGDGGGREPKKEQHREGGGKATPQKGPAGARRQRWDGAESLLGSPHRPSALHNSKDHPPCPRLYD